MLNLWWSKDLREGRLIKLRDSGMRWNWIVEHCLWILWNSLLCVGFWKLSVLNVLYFVSSMWSCCKLLTSSCNKFSRFQNHTWDLVWNVGRDDWWYQWCFGPFYVNFIPFRVSFQRTKRENRNKKFYSWVDSLAYQTLEWKWLFMPHSIPDSFHSPFHSFLKPFQRTKHYLHVTVKALSLQNGGLQWHLSWKHYKGNELGHWSQLNRAETLLGVNGYLS